MNTGNYINNKISLGENLKQSEKIKYKFGLEKLCDDFGLDFSLIRKQFEDEGHKIIIGEQMGNWFYPSYKGRIELLNNLMTQTDMFNYKLSGIKSLIGDTFTVDGTKSEHSSISYIDGIGKSSFFSRKKGKYFTGRTYDSVPVPIDFFHKFYDDLIKRITSLEDAFIIYGNSFADNELKGNYQTSTKILNKISSGIDEKKIPINPFIDWKPSREILIFLSLFLKSDDFLREEMNEDFNSARSINTNSWYNFFEQLNGEIFGKDIQNLDLFFSKAIGFIKNPKKLSEQILFYYQQRGINKENFTITGIIQEEKNGEEKIKKIYNVIYDKNEKKFFVLGKNNKKVKEIFWNEIIELSKKNLTTGPSGIIEYIILMSVGYVLIDDGEEVGFDIDAKNIFKSYTNRDAPLISISNQIKSIYFDINPGNNRRIVLPSENIFGFYSKNIRQQIMAIVNKF